MNRGSSHRELRGVGADKRNAADVQVEIARIIDVHIDWGAGLSSGLCGEHNRVRDDAGGGPGTFAAAQSHDVRRAGSVIQHQQRGCIREAGVACRLRFEGDITGEACGGRSFNYW